MKNILRQGISFMLPLKVLILIPLVLKNDFTLNSPFYLSIGVIAILTGLFLMVKSIADISTKGDGTLAPWSPAKKLVITGAYRFIRNPMIVGVLIILIGESICTESKKIFIWAIIFFIINNLFFFFYEEPNLEQKFGEEYRKYKKEVPRWIPKFHPRKTN
jgi:protein-S-isoprenylcysteine O-methyltransferase Ste14